jgi:hypothetical protein
MADLEDKQSKWQNVDTETKPAPTQDTRPEGGEPPPEEEPEPEAEEPAPKEEEPEPDKEEEPEKEEPKDKKKKKKVPPQFQKKESRSIKSGITFKDFLTE